jgi:hypothetical protein
VTAVAGDPVEEHVAALDRALTGPAKARRDLVREARDGLLDAADAYRRGGVDADRAARLAVRDFGPVAAAAALYQDELAAGQGRRTAVLLVVAVPALMLGWDLLWSTGVTAADPPPPDAVRTLARIQDVASLLVTPLALALLVLTFRRTRSPRRVAAASAVTAVVTVAVCGGTSIAMSVVNGAAAWTSLTARPAGTLACLVSAVALVLMDRSALRTYRTLRRPAPGPS